MSADRAANVARFRGLLDEMRAKDGLAPVASPTNQDAFQRLADLRAAYAAAPPIKLSPEALATCLPKAAL